MNNRGIIFDLDGVIVNTAGFHYLAWKNLANELGFDFTEAQNEAFKGVSRAKSLELLLAIGSVKSDENQKNTWLQSKNEDYLHYIEDMTKEDILPGVKPRLDYLKSKKVPIALGSASKNAKSILKRVELFDIFDAIVDGTDVQKAKPDPEVFLIAAQRMNIKPEEAIVFEDAIAGIQAANTAGMISVGIGDKEILNEADHVFKDFTEIDNSFLDSILNA